MHYIHPTGRTHALTAEEFTHLIKRRLDQLPGVWADEAARMADAPARLTEAEWMEFIAVMDVLTEDRPAKTVDYRPAA